MAAFENTITAADIAFAQDVEMTQNFDQSFNKLGEVLGLLDVETLAAGAALYQYEVSGKLADSPVTEGDEVPLSKYTEKKTPIGELTPNAYRKLTTAQAVLKHTYEHACMRTDKKMLQDVRKAILTQFFTLLGNGTGKAEGANFKAALIQADAQLADALDKAGDAAEGVVFFANKLDFADWAAGADVSNDGAGSVFGLDYVKNLAGVSGTVVFSSGIAKGTIFATPSDNIHVYTPDFAELAKGGLNYTIADSGCIGVAHEPAYNRVSCITNVLAGAVMVPEYKTYIVKATIKPAAAAKPTD